MIQQRDASTRYEVISQTNENDDLLIPIPPPLLQRLGWKEGDTIEITIDDHGRYLLSCSNNTVVIPKNILTPEGTI